MTASSPSAHLPGGLTARRAGRVGGLLLLVLAAHAWLLAGLPLGVGDGPLAGRAQPINARRIVLPAAAPPQPSPVAPSPRAAAAPRALPAPVPTAAPPRVEPAEPPPPVPEAKPPAEAAPEPAAIASAPDVTASAVGVADAASAPESEVRPPPPTGGEVPVYATRMPAAATLRYDLRRGAIGGEGTLDWRPGPEGYEMSIEGQVFGISVLSWRSRGAFDSAGIAPERFVDSRRGRDVRAANFQREAGKITFSGSEVSYPLVGGAQDRLSWMVQLAAVLEADQARRAAGEKVSMFVAGARGDGDVWTFSVMGEEELKLPGLLVPRALALRREPRKPFDTQVEVWLDPARQHLPARMRLTQLPAGDSTEFILRP